MIRRILVPLDRSALAERALGVAIPLARRHRAALRIVYAWPTQVGPIASQFGGLMSGPLEERGDAEGYLRKMAAEAQAQGIANVETALLAPPVAKAIRDEARETGTELIVMSTHGRTGWSRVWIGSVADAVIREAEIPVLLVRAREDDRDLADELRSVLVPLDGAPEGEAILDVLRAVFEATPVHIRLLRVVTPVLLAQVTPESGVPIVDVDEEATRRTQRDAESHLARLADGLRADLPEATVESSAVVNGAVARTLVEAARDVGLVAMVPSIHGAARLVLGSVTDKVLRGTDASFLVYRPPRADG